MGYTINLIGASASVWKIQHNVLHHTYTNVDHVDDDINVPPVLRFSPHEKRYWFHRFQHVYVWLFYGLVTIIWTTFKDFIKINRYRKMGFFQGKNEINREILKAILWKLLFYSYTLVIPMIYAPQSDWVVLIAFLCMHFVTGVCLSVVFQVAHVMPTSRFPLPDKSGVIKNDWSVHQLMTTTNFAPNSRIFTWLIGGLNYQVEHHLMPHISHVHYKNLSGIVSETVREFGLPYHSKRNFLLAISSHVEMLRQLGKPELSIAEGGS